MNRAIILISFFLFFGSMLIYFHEEARDANSFVLEESYLIGRIYSASRGSILIAERSEGEFDGDVSNLRGDAIWVTIKEGTRFTKSNGEEISLSDLSMGDKVEVWAENIYTASYPARGSAKEISLIRKEDREREEDREEVIIEKTKEEKEPIEVEIIINKKEDEIVFKAISSDQIYIPQEKFSSPPYLTGPWEVYKKGEGGGWKRIVATDKCAQPRCNQLDDYYEGCLPLMHPPECEEVSEEIVFNWNKEHVLRDRVMGTLCYRSVLASKGDYKVVFSYKEDPCTQMEISTLPGSIYTTENKIFHENIKRIEKEFKIEGENNLENE